MRSDAANIDADADRGIRKRTEWFKKHSANPQQEGFFDAAYMDERPGNCPTSRLLRRYANFVDALKAFAAIRPSRALPAELAGKTPMHICRGWDARRQATKSWEELKAAEAATWDAVRLWESKQGANPGEDSGTSLAADPDMVLAQRRVKEARTAYATAGGHKTLPTEKVEAECDRFRRTYAAIAERAGKLSSTLAEAKRDRRLTLPIQKLECRLAILNERAEGAKVKWEDAVTRRKRWRLIDRWETLIVAREPARRMVDALGPDRTNYEAAQRAFLDWERDVTRTTGRMAVRPNHPDPRSRASWEIREWVLPLRYACSEPQRFFTEIAPRYDPQEFDPQSIGPFETPSYLGALAECLREWGYGGLLHPAVRAAFDAAAQDSRVFGEMLAIAERKTTFPEEGFRAGGKRKRQKKVKPLAQRMNHWQRVFRSRSLSGKRKLLTENGISLDNAKRLPTVEGCALRVCAKERNAGLDATRKQWEREKMDTMST